MKNKKVLSIALSVSLLFSVATTSLAASDTSSYYEYLSKNTGKSVSVLKDIEKEYGDLSKFFNITIPSEVVKDSNSDVSVSEASVASTSFPLQILNILILYQSTQGFLLLT